MFTLGQAPTTKEAQAVADELYAEFVSEEVDKVEIIYTKFVSLIASTPTIQTLLPLTPQVQQPQPGSSQLSRWSSNPESPSYLTMSPFAASGV